MNNRAQETGIILFLGIVIGAFAVILLGATGYITGLIPCGTDVPNCQLVTREANNSIIGDKEFDGRGILGKARFNVKLKNIEEQAANFKINMLCNTAKKASTVASSDTIYVQPGMTEEFPIEYDVGILEDWRCVLSSIDSGTIDSCEAV